MLKLLIVWSLLFLIGWRLAWIAMPKLRPFIGSRFVGNYLAILSIDLFLSNIFVIWAVVFISTAFTIRGRVDGFCRFLLLSALVPAMQLKLAFGGVYLGEFSVICCLALAVLASLSATNDRVTRPIRGISVEDCIITTIFLICTIGAFRLDSITELSRQILSYTLSLIVPYMLLRRNLRSTADVHLGIACLVAAAFPIILFGIFEVASGWAMTDILSHGSGIAKSSQTRGGVVRASSMFGNPLIFSHYMLVILMGFFVCQHWIAKKWRKICLGFLIVGFLIPQSRGAYIALVPGAFVLLLTLRRYGSASAVLLVSGLTAFALSLTSGGSGYMGSMLRGSAVGDHYDYRGLLLERGTQEFWRYPLVGRRIGDVMSSMQDLTQGQGIIDFVNTYLWIALVSGGTGLGLFLLGVSLSMRRLVARAARGDDLVHTRAARAFLLATLSSTLIFIASMSLIGNILFSLCTLLAFARVTSAELMRPKRRAVQPLPVSFSPRPRAAAQISP